MVTLSQGVHFYNFGYSRGKYPRIHIPLLRVAAHSLSRRSAEIVMTLRGMKVVEMAGLAPVPFAGMIFADFGATVIRVDKMNLPPFDNLSRNKRSVAVNLKHSEGTEVVKKLCADADVLMEGFRPGVMEKLGLGPDVMLEINPKLIYAQLTGYGQSGSLAYKVGHDINYLAISGILSMLGRKDEPPYAPLNLLADFAGGSLFCVIGILLALIERHKSQKGQVIDSAMVDGCAYLGSFLNASKALGIWPNGRGENMLDGGSPFYNTYKTADNKYITVGAIEPMYYQALLQGLDIEESDLSWEVMKEKFTKIFLTKSRDEWVEAFSKLEVCFEPVLEIDEAYEHPHNKSRHFYKKTESGIESMPAPRLGRSPTIPGSFKQPAIGEHTVEILRELHYSHDQIADLIANEVVSQDQSITSSKL